MSKFACKVCQNTNQNITHRVREMMFGMREEFNYLECGNCACLQLLDELQDIAKYYPSNYYSFKKTDTPTTSSFRKFLFRKRVQQVLEGNSLLGSYLLRRGLPSIPFWIKLAKLKRADRILDVGCGWGNLLRSMHAMGFKHLHGADPYVAAETHDTGVHIYKKFVGEMQGPYDFIMFHHSFEHLPNPLEVLQAAGRIIAPGKQVLIRIPIAGKKAWRQYGVNWVGLDAPRHYFIHSEKSIEILARESGFTVEKLFYDSEPLQFWASEQYARDIPLHDPKSYAENPAASLFTLEQYNEFRLAAKQLNDERDGDQGGFLLRKVS